GSTDSLLGLYHLGSLTDDNRWRYFVQAQWDQPLAYRTQNHPGAEIDAALGAYYEGWALGPSAKVAPVLEFNATWRARDGGSEGDPENTGYTRLLVTPGLEFDVASLAIYLDVGLPVYMNAHANQLVSSRFWRLNLSHRF
ncbi:MAG TPA: hypothetical protein VMT50_04510, partial [Steroidobacteraceae bacterium]|nr:hypothetical protein [Steroidobacteraceae bacterium]